MQYSQANFASCFSLLSLVTFVSASCTTDRQARSPITPAGTEEEVVLHEFVESFYRAEQDLVLDYMEFDRSNGRYLESGWSNVEEDENGETSIWSIGESSSLFFYLSRREDLQIALTCSPLQLPGKKQTIRVSVNDAALETLVLAEQKNAYSFVIPKQHLRLGTNRIRFAYGYNISPKSLKWSSDTRRLGVRFYSLDFDPLAEDYVFYRGRWDDVFDLVANVSRVKIGDVTKWGIIQKPKSVVKFAKRYVPPGATLRFSLGFHPRFRGDHEVTFSIIATIFDPHVPDGGRILFRETLHPTEVQRWKDYSLDLAELASHVVEIAFVVGSNSDPHLTTAIWAEPRISGTIDSPKHNVVIITFDALRKDHLGLSGYSKNTTPNLDAFAAQAVRYQNSFSVSPWTAPSMATLHSGLYPQTHRTGRSRLSDPTNTYESSLSDYRRFPRAYPTMPTFLRPYGFYSQIIDNGGFLWFPGSVGITDDYDGLDKNLVNQYKPVSVSSLENFLKAYGDETFLLHLHVMPPHSPTYGIAPYDDAFLDWDTLRKRGAVDAYLAGRGILPYHWRDGWLERPEKRAYITALYDATLAMADEFFGMVIELLHREQLFEDSLVIVSADHGEQFWEHGELGHNWSLYNEEIAIPLFIKYPRRFGIPPHRALEVVSNIDVLPTILAVNGIDPPPYLEGESLLALEQDDSRRLEREYLFLSQNAPEDFYQGVVWQNYKLIRSGDGKSIELFDWTADFEEKNNLAYQEPEIVAKLEAALDEYVAVVAGGRAEGSSRAAEIPELRTQSLDEDVLERLRALGYVK